MIGFASLVAFATAGAGRASETLLRNAYGMPGGLIDMPTAETGFDGDLTLGYSYFAGTTRTTLSFQITPRLTGAFRYAALRNLGVPGYDIYTDRSFDLAYRLLDEGRYRPALSIGLRDFIGTGLYGSEYIVATKGFGDGRLLLTAGLGWGRLGSVGSLGHSGVRPVAILGSGGIPTYDRWFRGAFAGFGGVSFRASDRITLHAEYSSDAYARETMAPAKIFARKTPWNFGVDYQATPQIGLSAHMLHGKEIGLTLRYSVNPRTTLRPIKDTAPLPIARRSARGLGWADDAVVGTPAGGAADAGTDAGMAPGAIPQGRDHPFALAALLETEKLGLTHYSEAGTTAHVTLRNDSYDIAAQAVGRAARAMTRTVPPGIDTFAITLMHEGMVISTITLRRSDLETLEHAPASAIYSRAVVTDAVPSHSRTRGRTAQHRKSYPKAEWRVGPYVSFGLFDPKNPIRAEAGLRATGRILLAPGWVAEGSISARGLGRIGGPPRPSTVTPIDPLPVVRTDAGRYATGHRPKIDHLTLTHFGRPGPALFSRLSIGYLEPIYAGVSGEILWKPVDSRLALGLDINHVVKRGYRQLFDVQGYRVTTGHLSAYYDLGNGFHVQGDIGRYLAGDYGATISIDREFANGWRIGAFATKTNVSARNFGEGSFDKGIRISIPMSWVTGKPNRGRSNQVIHSLTRDGGARLFVNHRLYETIRGAQSPEMAKSWGKFWR